MTADIFNTKNVTDLPEEVKNQTIRVKFKDQDPLRKMIRHLFTLKEVLNINEILIGIYRHFNLIKKRHATTISLNQMAKRGEIIKVKSGIYKRAENEQA